jgi:hypothetical protein
MRLLELGTRLFAVRAITALKRETDARDGRSTWIRRSVCVGIVAVLIGSSAPSVKRAIAGPFQGRIDAFHSTNAYLQAVTGSANASERIIDVMASLPADKPLLIFERDRDGKSSLLGMALAYLAWPREVRFETVYGTRCDEQLAKIAPNSISGVAFCDLPSPAWIPGGFRLGKAGKLIALAPPGEKSK